MFEIEPRRGAVVLRLDDGKVNVMGTAFVEQFPAAWQKATADRAPIVLAGNARAFSAGLDLKGLPALGPAGLTAFGRGFMRLFRDVLAYERPVVAAVDGPALAGGAVLALAADLRLVGPRARLGLTEVPVGVPFPPAVATLATARLPPQEHAPALLRGLVREGDACVATGWAHASAPADRLLDDALLAAAEMGASSPVAYGSAKRALHAALVAEFDRYDAEAWTRELLRPESLAALQRTLERLAKR